MQQSTRYILNLQNYLEENTQVVPFISEFQKWHCPSGRTGINRLVRAVWTLVWKENKRKKFVIFINRKKSQTAPKWVISSKSLTILRTRETQEALQLGWS